MDHEADEKIAQGLRAGQSEAWLCLYDTYAERVWRLVARLTAPHAPDVPDVVQETFLAAARSARAFDPDRGSLWNWLSGIARNQAALHFRRRARQPVSVEAGGDQPAAIEAVDNHSPTEAAEGVELASQIRKVLTQLPADYETLLTAKYMEGSSVAEIARSNNTTDEAIRSKLARARRAFRSLFHAEQ